VAFSYSDLLKDLYVLTIISREREREREREKKKEK